MIWLKEQKAAHPINGVGSGQCGLPKLPTGSAQLAVAGLGLRAEPSPAKGLKSSSVCPTL